MQKRPLGNTGLELSLLGFGGFHLLECASGEATFLLNSYLDAGGNYIETAAGYGEGDSERKIGKAVSGRRSEFILASKGHDRTREGILHSLEHSLRNLQTDYLDLFFIHGVQDKATVDKVAGAEGAYAGALQAQEQGKVRFLAISGHGRQQALHYALERLDFAVLMTGFNYLDYCNFPYNEEVLLPFCHTQGTGVLAMKALADGYLYRSPEESLRYSLSLPVTSVVAGINNRAYLERDLKIIEEFKPLSPAERTELFQKAPELGDYVCRQCGHCRSAAFDPAAIFLLEGLYDRQLDDKRPSDPAEYALRQRLRFWFEQREEAQAAYRALRNKVDPSEDYSPYNSRCPYGIDIERKLKICHEKLGEDGYLA